MSFPGELLHIRGVMRMQAKRTVHQLPLTLITISQMSQKRYFYIILYRLKNLCHMSIEAKITEGPDAGSRIGRKVYCCAFPNKRRFSFPFK